MENSLKSTINSIQKFNQSLLIFSVPLIVQKQKGTQNFNLSVVIRFVLREDEYRGKNSTNV
jgi:hypothetical protein